MPLQNGITNLTGGFSQNKTIGIHLLVAKRIGLDSLSVRQKMAPAGQAYIHSSGCLRQIL